MRNQLLRRLPLLAQALALIVVLATPADALEQRALSYQRQTGTWVFPYLWGMVPGLTDVDMSFTGAEHAVTELSCIPHGFGWPELMVNLRDGNGDDRHNGVIAWGDLGPYSVLGTHEVSRTDCAGSCRIPITRLAYDEAFVLAGFSFNFHPSLWAKDALVEEIMVRPRPYSGYIDVTFDDGSQRPFDVFVSYVRIPLSAVASFDSAASQMPVAGGIATTRPRGPAVLQGFYLGFADHRGRPLHRFNVDITDAQLLRLSWRDLAGNDPFNWSASWLRLVD